MYTTTRRNFLISYSEVEISTTKNTGTDECSAINNHGYDQRTPIHKYPTTEMDDQAISSPVWVATVHEKRIQRYVSLEVRTILQITVIQMVHLIVIPALYQVSRYMANTLSSSSTEIETPTTMGVMKMVMEVFDEIRMIEIRDKVQRYSDQMHKAQRQIQYLMACLSSTSTKSSAHEHRELSFATYSGPTKNTSMMILEIMA